MNRRHFFRQLASGLVTVSAPSLFLPKLIKPAWRALIPDTITDPETAIRLMLSEVLQEFQNEFPKDWMDKLRP